MPVTMLWQHQERIVNWISHRDETLVAAGMGTGKTLSALTAAERLHKGRPVLVATTRAATDSAWEEQIAEHLQGGVAINVATMRGSIAEKARLLSDELNKLTRRTVYVLINYEAVWRPAMLEALKRTKFALVVADESHLIKTANTKSGRAMQLIGRQALRRVAMTGTPLPNGPEDIFGQAQFLSQEFFGKNRETFLQRYTIREPVRGLVGVYRIVAYQRQDEFQEILRRFMLRIETKDVRDMPVEHYVQHKTQLTDGEYRAYKQLKRDMITEFAGKEIIATHILTKILRLHQMTGQTEGKYAAILEIFEQLPKDEPVVVFAKFTEDVRTVHAAAEKAGLTRAELSGRINELEEWRKGRKQVLVVQIETGAEGIDLGRASYAVFFSMTWRNDKYEQAKARLLTRGVARTVHLYHLVARGTIDEIIYTALKNKQDAAMKVLDAILNEE